jgi:hypothetical protein
MDPYLELPEFWAEVHNRLIVAIADDLAPRLRPRYRVAIEHVSPIMQPITISLDLPEEVRESYL